jgi:hypothetical protein
LRCVLREEYVLLDVPGHLATVFIVVDLRRRFVVTRHGGSIVVKTWMRTKGRGE